MNYFFVDYENVKTHGLEGIDRLKPEDVVCIFYSENADSLTFDLHRRLNESQAQIIYQKVEVGMKNALDFQLSSYLGYVICDNKSSGTSYFIVTKDHGFLSLVGYWKKREIDIAMVPDLAGGNDQKAPEDLKRQVEQRINDKDDVNTVVDLMQRYETKQDLHNALVKKFPGKDQKKADEIYKAIKSLFAGKKGK